MKKSLLNIVTSWSPASILSKEGPKSKFCLIVLNQPIQHVETFHRLWSNGKKKNTRYKEINLILFILSCIQVCC